MCYRLHTNASFIFQRQQTIWKQGLTAQTFRFSQIKLEYFQYLGLLIRIDVQTATVSKPIHSTAQPSPHRGKNISLQIFVI